MERVHHVKYDWENEKWGPVHESNGDEIQHNLWSFWTNHFRSNTQQLEEAGLWWIHTRWSSRQYHIDVKNLSSSCFWTTSVACSTSQGHTERNTSVNKLHRLSELDHNGKRNTRLATKSLPPESGTARRSKYAPPRERCFVSNAAQDKIKTRPAPTLVGAECGPVTTRSQSNLVRTTRTLRGTAKFPSDRASHHDPGKSGLAPADTCPFAEGKHLKHFCVLKWRRQGQQPHECPTAPPDAGVYRTLVLSHTTCSLTQPPRWRQTCCPNAKRVHDNGT